MNAATASEIACLETMTITKVVERFESLFGEKCRSRNKRYLIRRIAWRLQANAEGDLSERARARAAELALDSEVRVTPPRETIQPRLVTADVQSRPALDQRLPPPGSMLHRDYKGRQIRVLIVNNGFEYEGQLFRSLTAEVTEQPIDWQNCATGRLDRSHCAIRSAQSSAVLGDDTRSEPRAENLSFRPVYAYLQEAENTFAITQVRLIGQPNDGPPMKSQHIRSSLLP